MSAGRKPSSGPEVNDQPYWGIFEAVSDGLIILDPNTHRIVEANSAAAAMHGFSREEFIGLPVTDYIHPDSQSLFSETIGAIESGGVFESPALHLRRDGSAFHVEVRRTAFTYQSRVCLLSVVRDISRQVHSERQLAQEAEVRQRERSTLLDISNTLASTLELKPDLILDQLREIVDYTHAALFESDDSSLVAIALRGVRQPENTPPFRIHLDGPETLTRLLNEHRPIRIADVWGPDEQAQFLRSLLKDQATSLLDGVQAWMWVPLAVKGRIIGGIGVAHSEKDHFTSHQADLAVTVANQAAITMINAELYINAQALAVLQERQRLAQNLHDAVNQSLFSAGLIAEVLPRLWERDQEEARRSLEDLRRLTRGALAEMRALLAELRPSTLTDAELGDLLRLLANGFTGRTNIPAKLTLAGTGVLPAEVQVAIYRVCQEALNNIAKHAGAETAEISLKHEGSGIELTIRDDGRGFDPAQTLSGHYGLTIMQERAQAVGAVLSITSRPGRGTELTVRWTSGAAKEAA
ncbi:MAG TPA: histidine kinase [Anaerolineales bacterium]|jgi:two-component system nitrate/nitrite sensor histidine kinase NarX